MTTTMARARRRRPCSFAPTHVPRSSPCPSCSPVPAAVGWDHRCEALFAPHADAGLIPGRVARVDRGAATVLTADGPVRAATPTGPEPTARRAVGDWVALDPDRGVAAVLDRRSRWSGATPAAPPRPRSWRPTSTTSCCCTPSTAHPTCAASSASWSSPGTPGAIPVVRAHQGRPGRPRGGRRLGGRGGGGRPRGRRARPERGRRRLAGRRLGPAVAAGHARAAGPLRRRQVVAGQRPAGEDLQAIGEVRASDGKGRHTTVASQLLPLARRGC